MTKIVVLDGLTLVPILEQEESGGAEVDWLNIEDCGDLTVYDRTEPEKLIERAAGADILLTNKTLLDAEALSRLPELKFISVLATGFNVVDIQAARARGISVSNVPGYSTESVVQSAVGHLLNLAGALAEHTEEVRSGAWSVSPDFCFYNRPLIELAGKRLGVVGLGTIGRRVAEVARALRMEVVAYGPHLEIGREIGGVKAVSLDELFRSADAVTLHCPMTADSARMIDAARLATMKRTAFLINTARGGLIDEEALADALNEGRLAGAGLDVLSSEPPKPENRLLSAKNCFITPHNAWATLDARKRLLNITAANIRAFLAGNPQNVVN